MGRDIETTEFTPDDRLRFRQKVKANLSALRQLVDSGCFETGRRTCGVEMEIYITDPEGSAVPINANLLERIASADFQTELATFTIKFGVKPLLLTGHVFDTTDTELRRSLNRAHDIAEDLGARMTIIGILPTLKDVDFTEDHMSGNQRYKALNDMILKARGEDILINIEGVEELQARASSILFEAACTSMQLHLQVDSQEFGLYWNAAQTLSAPLVAVGANSPFFLGRQLQHETRIALFEQAIETRTEELVLQGVRPRVWFGEKWLDDGEGLWDLFDENVRYSPALLPLGEDEDPAAMFEAGEASRLPELTLHNGTIYRWNRPVYEVVRGRPHMRIENRVMPASPSVPDSGSLSGRAGHRWRRTHRRCVHSGDGQHTGTHGRARGPRRHTACSDYLVEHRDTRARHGDNHHHPGCRPPHASRAVRVAAHRPRPVVHPEAPPSRRPAHMPIRLHCSNISGMRSGSCSWLNPVGTVVPHSQAGEADPGMLGSVRPGRGGRERGDDPRIARRWHHTVGQLARIVADGVARGEFAVADPTAAARAAFDATTRVHNPAHATTWSDPDMDTAFDGVWTLVIGGFGGADPAPEIGRPAGTARWGAHRHRVSRFGQAARPPALASTNRSPRLDDWHGPPP